MSKTILGLALALMALAIPASAQTTYYATPQFACHVYSYSQTSCFETLKDASGTQVGTEVLSLFGAVNTNPTSAVVYFYDANAALVSSYTVTLTSPSSGTIDGGSLAWTLQTVRCKCGYKGSWSTLTYLSGSVTITQPQPL